MSSTTTLIRSITIYGGMPIFVFGIIGNLLNLLLLWPTRHNSCAFLFLFSSIVNFVVLFGLLTRILIVGFDVDWTPINLGWCKTRAVLTLTSNLISLSCICLASIDRFLNSCRQQKYRKWSRLSTARWAVAICVLIWIGHAVPYIVYYQILSFSSSDNKTSFTCSLVSNTYFTSYIIYFVYPVLYGVIPSTVLGVMGMMTYRNMNMLQLARQRQIVQRHLTLMLLVQIPIIIVSLIPFAVFAEYLLLTATMIKPADQVARETIIRNIFSLLFYMIFACPFFVFFISSPTFRQEAKILLLCRYRNRMLRNRVQRFTATGPILNANITPNIT